MIHKRDKFGHMGKTPPILTMIYVATLWAGRSGQHPHYVVK